MSKLVTIYFILLSLTPMSAQRTSLEKAVLKLFDRQNKVIWMRHFHGQVDDASDIAIVLAYDGKLCRGRLEYLKSGEQLGLIGFMKNQKIRLLEVNQSGDVSGFMQGRLNGNALTFDWSSTDNNIASSMVLKESIHEKRQLTDCAKRKWIRTFRGLLDDKEVEFLLQKEGEGQIRGIVFFEERQLSYEAKGSISRKNEIEIVLTDNHKKRQGSFRGLLTKKGIVEGVFLNPYGARTKGNFWQHENVKVGCVDYADYISSLNISFPAPGNFVFNDWMQQLIEELRNGYTEYARKVRLLGEGLSPDTRASVRTHGWYDLDYLSVNIISGTLSISNSWENTTQIIPFTFDMDQGRPITLTGLFDRDFNLQDFIWQYISTDIQEHQYYKDYDFRKWLSTANFDSFTIRKEGISFSTPFSAIYGKQQFTIPYTVLKPHLNPNSPIWGLVE